MTAELKFFKQPPVIESHLAITALAQVDALLSGYEKHGRSYREPAFVEGIEDARRIVEMVRISTLKALRS